MPLNPSLKPEMLNNPTQRANSLNDPQFENAQGYFPYDLTHGEYTTPRFGEITPTLHLDTVPGDRITVHDNTKLVLNRIDGTFMSTMNQYIDSFYIPLRCVFPINYEKLIPNPVKGSDLPNSALPQIPFFHWIKDYLTSSTQVAIFSNFSDEEFTFENGAAMEELNFDTDEGLVKSSYALGRMTMLAYILSRGQLLDYLGVNLDIPQFGSTQYYSQFQDSIDAYFLALWRFVHYTESIPAILGTPLNLNQNIVDLNQAPYRGDFTTVENFRRSLHEIFERGLFLNIKFKSVIESGLATEIQNAYANLRINILSLCDFPDFNIDTIDSEASPFETGAFLNIGKILAYQQVVAHYYSNDSVDNIFTSDLYMQNLRAVMYPSFTGEFTQEPIFRYNGVQTEYDLISCGGFYYSQLRSSFTGHLNRQYVLMSVLFMLRKSLRYGDYFSTARTRQLAVSDQLFVALTTDGDGNTGVSPLDVTKNLLMQRYLNAANYVGSRFLNFYASLYGVTPSDTGTFPRFLSHRKIELQNQLTNNTSDEQGKQTTNLVGYSDNAAFDVFIDDFGYILSLQTFDVLPVYLSGIDSSYHFTDRFDYFNPMLQGVGDQPIRVSELMGTPSLYDREFGWSMRNAEYKFKLSKGHGAFATNALPGFLFKYPTSDFTQVGGTDVHISPEFIRDKPSYLDKHIPSITGVSPCEYFHFVCASLNQVHCARKIQATPPVLF